MKKMLITGGAGFIGINAADHFAKKGYEITVFDNFSRKGSEKNAKWLVKNNGKKIMIVKGDIRTDGKKLKNIAKDVSVVLHFAGQVAVTTSVTNPREDFDINALGTFNVLEAIRLSGNNPILINASTNKVYGELESVKTVEKNTRYEFRDLKYGVSEDAPLDFHSPYGCSKGTADQYVRDYHRIYGLNTVVFRQSCIYGPHQFGIEDQGWVAWFIIALTLGKDISIYGNGKQVRDILYVEDLIQAFELAIKNIKITRGQIYNIGGGYKNSISIWKDFEPILAKLFNRKIDVKFDDWRPGDQPIFIADIRKAKKEFGWQPTISPKVGIAKLFNWVQENKSELAKIF